MSNRDKRGTPTPRSRSAAAADTAAGPATDLARRRWLWLATALLAGAVAMSLEIAAARLLAPYLGSSLQVWGSLISVVMAAMAAGYALGGRLADQWRGDRPLYGAILTSGLCQVGALFAAHPLLRALSAWGEIAAAAVAIGVLFAAPTLLLAAVGPFVIRLTARDRVGTTSGAVFALGTIGSIGGVLLTSFVLLPSLGTRATLQGLAGVTLVLGALGLLPNGRAAAGLLVLALPMAPDRSWAPGTIWREESIYHVVQVVERGSLRGLLLDQEQGLHSALDLAGGRADGYWSDFAVGPLLARGGRVLVLGMGAGASVRAVQLADPEATIDAVEIDPVVVRAAAEQFGVAAGPRLRVHVEDARRFLARSREPYDVVQLDLFRGGPEIPSHLVTREFFARVGARLRPGGVLMMNVFDLAPGHPLLASVAATLAPAFPSLFARVHRGMNYVVLAFPERRGLPEVLADLETAPTAALGIAREVARGLRPLEAAPGAIVFTDDRAPIERATRQMMAAARAAGTLPLR